MALIKCPDCGNMVSDKADACPVCGKPVANILRELKGTEEPSPIATPAPTYNSTETLPESTEIHISDTVPTVNSTPEPEPNPEPTPIPAPVPEKESRSNQYKEAVVKEQKEDKPKKKSNAALISIIAASVILLLGVGGYFYYDKVYLPKKIDAEAPRYYTYAPSVVMRSSPTAGVDYNKLGSLSYGTELITYSAGSEWCNVKVSAVGNPLNGQVGYVASPYVLEKSDFFRLNSIFGDNDSKDIIKTAKCRKALLDYYKERGFVGKISTNEAEAWGLPYPSDENQWQVFCKQESSKKNNVYYARLYDKNSKFTDFAVLIKNINRGERRLLYFAFGDDESVIWQDELDAPDDGCINRIAGGRYPDGEFAVSVSYVENDD